MAPAAAISGMPLAFAIPNQCRRAHIASKGVPAVR